MPSRCAAACAEHGDRLARGCRVQYEPAATVRADRCGQAEACGLHRQSVRVDGGDQRAAVDVGARRAGLLHLLDRPDAGDHSRARRAATRPCRRTMSARSSRSAGSCRACRSARAVLPATTTRARARRRSPPRRSRSRARRARRAAAACAGRRSRSRARSENRSRGDSSVRASLTERSFMSANAVRTAPL